jgi:hypothetical protein
MTFFLLLVVTVAATSISCQQWPQVRMNRQFKFIRNNTMYVMPAPARENDLYQDTATTLTNIIKSKKIYTIADPECGTKPRLAKYAELYRNNALSPQEIGEIAALLRSDSGYLVFSSLDSVNVHNYSREKPMTPRVGNHHAMLMCHINNNHPLYTDHAGRRLSMYDIASGEEFLKIDHKIIREKRTRLNHGLPTDRMPD